MTAASAIWKWDDPAKFDATGDKKDGKIFQGTLKFTTLPTADAATLPRKIWNSGSLCSLYLNKDLLLEFTFEDHDGLRKDTFKWTSPQIATNSVYKIALNGTDWGEDPKLKPDTWTKEKTLVGTAPMIKMFSNDAKKIKINEIKFVTDLEYELTSKGQVIEWDDYFTMLKTPKFQITLKDENDDDRIYEAELEGFKTKMKLINEFQVTKDKNQPKKLLVKLITQEDGKSTQAGVWDMEKQLFFSEKINLKETGPALLWGLLGLGLLVLAMVVYGIKLTLSSVQGR